MPNDVEKTKKSSWIVKEAKRACIGLAAGLVAAVGVTTYVGLSGSPAADVQTSLTSVQQKRATAPRFVSGYTYHCSIEMEEANATGPEIDHVVENYYLSARYDEEEATWRYPGPSLIVVLNNSGFCVTVFRP